MSSRRFVLIFAVVSVLAACGPAPTAPSILNSTQAPLPDVVARVNGADITRAEYERAVARLSPGGTVAQLVSDQVLSTLIEQRLIEQAAIEMDVSVTDDDVAVEINALKALTGDWNVWLAENGYTEAEFTIAIRSNLLTQRVREAVLAQTGEVNTIRTVHARHILLGSEAEAQAIRQRLDNGEAFGDLAARLSRDVTTRDAGGDLGYFVREDLTTPELADLAFSLDPGEVAGPVQTALGWHIVQTIEFAERPVAEGSEAVALEQRFTDWLNNRRQGATVLTFF